MTELHNFFDLLPDEMILNISSYLEYEDIQSLRLTCLRFEIVLKHIFEETSKLVIDRWRKFNLSLSDPKYNFVYRCDKSFTSIRFNEYDFDGSNQKDIEEFFNIYAKNIENLELRYCKINEVSLLNLLDILPKLKSLELGTPYDINGAKIIEKVIDRIRSLTFSSQTYFDKDAIERITPKGDPMIEQLNLEYVRDHKVDDENVTSFQQRGVYPLLQKIAKNLKKFNIFSMNCDEDIVECLNQINLNLEALKIYISYRVEDDHFDRFAKQLKNLVSLEISGTYFSDEDAECIFDNMKNLKSLSFGECDVLSNDGIKNVVKLKNLEEFKINTCQNISNKGISEGIAKTVNLTLKCFLINQHQSDDVLVSVATNLLNLKSLCLSTCLYFTPKLVPLIYERLQYLNELTLSSLNSPEDHEMFEPHEVNNVLIPPPLANENTKVSALKNLTKLEIYGFDGIPGASIEDISEIKNLKELTLHNYNQITKDDLINILKKCRKIRKIDLRYCNDFLSSEDDYDEIRLVKNCKTTVNINFGSI